AQQQFRNSDTATDNAKTDAIVGAGNPSFLGIQTIFTSELKITDERCYDPLPIFRILNPSHERVQLPEDFKLDENTLTKIYRKMVTLNIMDKILYESQRQGRISFYMTNTGEEAIQIGSAAAITLEDVIYAQYREAGVLLWRGHTIADFMNQCYGNHKDAAKGRQMPVHYGSKKLNFVTISSPLTTQLPQGSIARFLLILLRVVRQFFSITQQNSLAVGTAYALKRSKRNACAVCYFGEGAASEGDAHAAFNFAATLDCPIFKGDGIAARGPAYGIPTIRVDGNDVLATYHATKVAREFSIRSKKPFLIEAMTYRDEIAYWNHYMPIIRYHNYLESIGLWCERRDTELKKHVKNSVLLAFAEAEKERKACWKELFTDVYRTMPKHI
ncbi:unnamed protein product, partial [Heterotrigona itama]